MKNLPVIAITMGDPAGIGTEIILKALEKREIFKYCIPIIVGDKDFLKKTAKTLKFQFHISKSNIIDLKNIPKNFTIGRPSRVSGKAAVEYIKSAVSLAKIKKVNAIVTAPISKEAIHMAGYKYPGHTEMLAEFTDTRDYAMMLESPPPPPLKGGGGGGRGGVVKKER